MLKQMCDLVCAWVCVGAQRDVGMRARACEKERGEGWRER